jgi:putative oxygen-independent coproporphyrinogen III oxidase
LLRFQQIRMAKVERPRNSEPNRLAFYIHIPYCIARCGYCDFNTYTPTELKSDGLASLTGKYIDSVVGEIAMASNRAGSVIVPSIFFGGGTPSLLPASELVRVISAIKSRFELANFAEITVEVNPDSLSTKFLDEILAGGVNRISMGMQSAVPHVLAALDRTHNPENVVTGVELIRAAGFEHCSVDLIYGVPGESLDDWKTSVDTALSLPIDHLSAYALIVESGTKLAARIKRGELELPPDDETAEKYLMIDVAAQNAGLSWYELSNWAKPGGECRHNIAYWDGSHWWGIGPGAHSYLDGKRWWNVKHPNTYQARVFAGELPIENEEFLNESDQAAEFLMLNIRMRSGISLERLSSSQIGAVAGYLDSGHLDRESWSESRLILTPTGRLIADRIVREMLV